jgi:hypothetical protein
LAGASAPPSALTKFDLLARMQAVRAKSAPQMNLRSVTALALAILPVAAEEFDGSPASAPQACLKRAAATFWLRSAVGLD